MQQDGIMKKFINSELFSFIVFLIAMVTVSKAIWLVIALLFLPSSGVEYSKNEKASPLYYHIKLASSKPLVQASPKPQAQKSVQGNMQGYKLLALYSAKDVLVVTVEKAKKTEVLAKGETIDGFKLIGGGSDYALFSKGNREFKLLLDGTKSRVSSIRRKSSQPLNTAVVKSTSTDNITESEDGVGKVVQRGLLNSYTKDVEKIWKDIGISEYKVNGKLGGFKVNFVKRDSDFEKLGLKRGDILTSVNGQELNSYNAAFSFYKEIETVENLTLSIKRDNKDMELEYEIQ